MSRRLELSPFLADRSFAASVRVPGSKSITNRALLCAALCPGRTRLEGVGLSEDSRHMAEALRRLGAGVSEDASTWSMEVDGLGSPPMFSPDALPEVQVGNAGTAARFLPCFAAAGRGRFLFESDPRMRERPMGPLMDVLEAQGARFVSAGVAAADDSAKVRGYPFVLEAAGLKGGNVDLDLDESSQFASGLLMAAPYATSDLRLSARGGRLQFPYVDMSAAVMASFGVPVEGGRGRWGVAAGRTYRSPGRYLVEPDLSGAAYFFAAAALVPGQITVRGVGNAGIQGDLRFLKVLQHLGLRFAQDEEGLCAWRPSDAPLKGGITVDMNAFSDQALTLAVLAPFCDGPVKITGIGHIRRQECDRIAAISANMEVLGVGVTEGPDWVEIQPWAPKARRGGLIRTYGDHRVAMAFSLIGLAVPGLSVDDADCVGKTFGDFWAAMDSLREAQLRGA